MRDTPDTEHKKYRFGAAEFGDGTPYIITEPIDGQLMALKYKHLYFTLSEGVSFSEAEEIVKLLNKKIFTIGTTTFGMDVEFPRLDE
jgi:hypothetical protein